MRRYQIGWRCRGYRRARGVGDPIEDLRRACEVIRASTGARDPRYVVVPATLWARLEAYADEQRARRRRPGIDS